MLKPIALIAFCIAALGVVPSSAQIMSAEDKAFVHEAAKGGMKEVELGRLGEERGSSQAVKQFSQRLVKDHSKANSELAALAKKKNVMLPAEETKAAHSSPLAAKSGAEFDKAFKQAMIEDHQKDIAAFEEAAKTASDPDLKIWAGKTLPTLRAHLKAAQALP